MAIEVKVQIQCENSDDAFEMFKIAKEIEDRKGLQIQLEEDSEYGSDQAWFDLVLIVSNVAAPFVIEYLKELFAKKKEKPIEVTITNIQINIGDQIVNIKESDQIDAELGEKIQAMESKSDV